MTAPAPGSLVEIRILEMSLDAYRHTTEHHDELFREFALIQSRDLGAGHEVPDRLLTLIERLNGQYAGMTVMPQGELDAALERGDTSVDLVYLLPADVGEACAGL